jgi:hypothetical protein
MGLNKPQFLHVNLCILISLLFQAVRGGLMQQRIERRCSMVGALVLFLVRDLMWFILQSTGHCLNRLQVVVGLC